MWMELTGLSVRRNKSAPKFRGLRHSSHSEWAFSVIDAEEEWQKACCRTGRSILKKQKKEELRSRFGFKKLALLFGYVMGFLSFYHGSEHQDLTKIFDLISY